MKLLQLCMIIATSVVGVIAGPRIVRAQALGEASTLSAGVSSAVSGSASALGNSLGRATRGEADRLASSGKTSTSGGVVNLHWRHERLTRSARSKTAKAKVNAKARNEKPRPDFVIFGADPEVPDSGDGALSQPGAAHPSARQPKPSNDKSSSGHSREN